MNLNIVTIQKKLKNKEISALELVTEYIEIIKQKNKILCAFNHFTFESAIKNAKRADWLFEKRENKTLTGIPYSLKDNFCTKGIKTTAGSKILDDYEPPYSSTVYEKLCEQNSIIIGKTSMDEFAMGSTGQFSPKSHTKAKNPYDISRAPGGSSSGSAVSVAAGLVPFSIGSDTGGSVIQPSSFCGITGLKPTYGRISRYGLIAYSNSFDHVGIMANSAVDCGIVLSILAGKDQKDQTSIENNILDFNREIGKKPENIKIGIVKEFFECDVSENVKKSVMKAANFYEKNGATLIECNFKSFKYALNAYYLISCSEASSNLALYDSIRFGNRILGESYEDTLKKTRTEGFGDEVKKRILLGNYALSHEHRQIYFEKARAILNKIKDEYNEIFKIVDVLIYPNTPSIAPLITNDTYNTNKMYNADILTVCSNLTGVPTITTTCGYENGMPIGFSLSSNHCTEDFLIGVCDFFEKHFNRKLAKI